MKVEQTGDTPVWSVQLWAVLRNAMQSSQVRRVTDYTACRIRNKMAGTHETHFVHAALNGDRLMNHSLVGAPYDKPLLCNDLQAFRLIVSNVGTHSFLIPAQMALVKKKKTKKQNSDPNAGTYIMSNPLSLSLPFLQTWRKAALVKSSWSCYVRRTAGGTPTPWAWAHTYTHLLQN